MNAPTGHAEPESNALPDESGADANEGDDKSYLRELEFELELSAPLGPQPGDLPSCRLFRNDVARSEVIAGAALGGEFGDEYRTLEFVNAVLSGEVDPDLLDRLERIRRQRARLQFANVTK